MAGLASIEAIEFQAVVVQFVEGDLFLVFPLGEERRHPFADILEFAHIARPGIGRENRQRRCQQPRLVQLRAQSIEAAAQQHRRERLDVLATLAQGWQGQFQGIDAVVQVLAELPRLNQARQRLVGGRDHAHIDRDRQPIHPS
ncbi:hypothetical protein M2C83_04910 [Cupriavidus basilensis]|nr:hypothetical protein [Cupriavidus basilensis]